MNQNAPSTSPIINLIEGIDYYIENGQWIFTSEYLLKRGKCCKNGCRNCPYGKLKKDKKDAM